MGRTELVPVHVAAVALGVDLADLKVRVMHRFRSDTIVIALMRLFELGFVPTDLLGSLLREDVRERRASSLALPACHS